MVKATYKKYNSKNHALNTKQVVDNDMISSDIDDKWYEENKLTSIKVQQSILWSDRTDW